MAQPKHILLTKSIDLNHKVLMLVKTYCVYKYRVHFESPGLKTVLRKLRSLNFLGKTTNIMHSLVASVILNMDGLKRQINSKSDFKLSLPLGDES